MEARKEQKRNKKKYLMKLLLYDMGLGKCLGLYEAMLGRNELSTMFLCLDDRRGRV